MATGSVLVRHRRREEPSEGLRSALLRYLGCFDSRVVALTIALLLLAFCLVLSIDSVAAASAN